MSILPNINLSREAFDARRFSLSKEDAEFLYRNKNERQMILVNIDLERCYQIAKWGYEPMSTLLGLAVLAEEVGEANKAAIEKQPDQFRSELVQVAAVCVCLIEEHDKRMASLKEFEQLTTDQPTFDDLQQVTDHFYGESKPETKPTGYLNGKIRTIEHRLQNLFNRVNEVEKRLEICERYESKVEAVEERLAKLAVSPVDDIQPVTQDADLKEARKVIKEFEKGFPRPWTVDRRDLICDSMGLSLHAGVHLNDYIDALRTLAGLK